MKKKLRTMKFRQEYIQDIIHGRKTATTRLKCKPLGVYQVISVNRQGKQIPMQLFIEIESVLSWKDISNAMLESAVINAEGFKDWKSYQNTMCDIYGEDPAVGFRRKRTFHTFFFVKADNGGE